MTEQPLSPAGHDPAEADLVEQTVVTPIAVDDRYHHYTGNRIPWFVRLIWLFFWGFAIYYTVQFLFPAVQVELIGHP